MSALCHKRPHALQQFSVGPRPPECACSCGLHLPLNDDRQRERNSRTHDWTARNASTWRIGMPCAAMSDVGVRWDNRLNRGACRVLTHNVTSPPSISAVRKGSFDYLVSNDEQVVRNFETERLCGLKVECQLEFCRLLDRQIARPVSFQDAIDIGSRAAE
jgi:hypothetical protein